MLLIAALLPIVVAIITLALWDLPQANSEVAYTTDGRLLGLNCDWGAPRPGMKVCVWDLTRRRKLVEVDGPFDWAGLSPDGATLIVAGEDAASVVDVATRQTIAAEVPELAAGWWDWSFSDQGKYIVSLRGGTVTVWEVAPWRTLGRLDVSEIPCLAVAVARDGDTLALGLDNGKIELWSLVSQQRTGALDGFEPGLSLIFSPDGRRLGSANAGVKIWDLATGAGRTVSAPAIRAAAARFSPDGSKLLVVHDDNTLSIVNLDPQAGEDDETDIGQLASWPSQFSPNSEHLAGLGPSEKIRTLNLRTSQWQTIKPASTLFLTAASVVCILFAAWSLAWILRRTPGEKPYRPFFDLLLVWAIFLSAVAARIFGAGSMYDVKRPVMQLGLTCLGCCLAFVVIWAVLGTARWSLRAAGLVGLCTLATAPMLLWQEFDWYLWQTLSGVLTLTGSLFVFLKLWQLARDSQLARLGAEESPAGRRANGNRDLQFPLGDLLLWTTAASLVVGVTMHFKPVALPPNILLFVVLEGVAAAAVAAASCGVAWGNRWRVLRVCWLAVVVVLAGSLQFLFRDLNLVSPGWAAARPAIMACLVTLSLLVFRYHGYRLRGRQVLLEYGL